MAWPSARHVNSGGGTAFGPPELNGIQDQILRANGILDTDLATAVVAALALPAAGGTVRRGVCAVETEQLDNDAAYTVAATPDRVSLTVPTDSILRINFRGLWKQEPLGNPNNVWAAIFINGSQLQTPGINGYQVQETTFFNGTQNVYCYLSTFQGGLFSTNNNSGAASIALPQAICSTGGAGGELFVKAPAGTYDVEVRYKQTLGGMTYTIKQRRLWVCAHGL